MSETNACGCPQGLGVHTIGCQHSSPLVCDACGWGVVTTGCAPDCPHAKSGAVSLHEPLSPMKTREKIAKLDAEHRSVMRDLARARRQLVAADDVARDARAERRNLRAHIDKLREDLEQARKTSGAIEFLEADARRANKQLLGDLAQERERIARLETDYNAVDLVERRTAALELAKERGRARQARSELALVRAELEQACEKIAKLDAEREGALRDIAGLTGERDHVRECYEQECAVSEQLRKDLSATANRAAELGDQLDHARSDNKQLRKALGDAETERDAVRGDIAREHRTCRLEHVAEITQLRTSLDDAREQIAAMHAAAVGGAREPTRGVVEDVADLRVDLERERAEPVCGNGVTEVSIDTPPLTVTVKAHGHPLLDAIERAVMLYQSVHAPGMSAGGHGGGVGFTAERE